MIIGIAGKAGAGKDTAADILVRRRRFVKVGLADPLKRICRDVFDFSEDQLWGPSEKRNEPDRRCVRVPGHTEPLYAGSTSGDGRAELPRYSPGVAYVPAEYLTPRHALQQLGTEWGRGCYENVWIDYALRIAREILAGCAYTAICGLLDRDWMSPRGGVVIPDVRFPNELAAIEAAGGRVVRIVRPGTAVGEHVSETALDAYTLDEIDNRGSVEDLEARILEWVDK